MGGEKMRKVFAVAAALALLGLSIAAQAAISIDTVSIGNAGNAADSTGYGSVAYEYNIGTYEVTAGQYTAFLNSVAKIDDAHGLYSTNMWDDAYGCKIQRTGYLGSYSYGVANDRANMPVNYVSWGDAARFANWLHNGQTTGAQNASTTEDGAYALNDAWSNAQLLAVNRESDWKWAITSEDEWYKAAYYTKGGGAYSLYANGSSTRPGIETDSNYGGTGGTYASAWDGFTNGTLEQNGTKDMMGNVMEWNESRLGPYRGLRGGFYLLPEGFLQASERGGNLPTAYYDYIGFRVSSIPGTSAAVPEPMSMMLGIMGLGSVAGFRRLRRK